ncbi:MAG TPA: TonB-dependent receptor [Gemmatimonadales bacterium]|nr:TonB-dependent receptor [Gemmatimonadales bacterium]
MTLLRPARFTLPLAAAALLAGPAAAQSVSGILRDSLLTGGALPNATLTLEGVNATAKSDLYGRFTFDSVPPGTYVLTFTHPAFLSAGVAAPKWRVQVPPEGVANLLFATPSADARYGRACPGGPRAPNTGYFIGTVRDAATDSALAGAVVTAMWSEISVSKATGVVTARRTSRAESNAQGLFVVCRVPNDAPLTVWAAKDSASTGLILLDLGGRPLAARQLTIGTKRLVASAADSSAVLGRLDGVVRSIDGDPIPDARVYVRGSRAIGRTSASGAFSLSHVPAGTQTLEVIALGYEPGRMAVDVRPGAGVRTEVTLGKAVTRLPDVQVAGGKSAMDEIADRARRSNGYLISQEDIERRGSITFEDIMRGVPGMQVVPVGQGYRVISSRGPVNAQGDCAPQYFVDGSPFPMPLNDDSPFPVSPPEIMAVEVYSGVGAVPAEYQRGPQNACGVIAIWTKRGGSPRPPRR